MAVNKVEANGETLIDLTNDTAGASDVLEGKTLHLASGERAEGTYRPSDEIEARLKATVGHSSKNLLDVTKHVSYNISNIQINEDTGSLSCTGTGVWCAVSYLTNDDLSLKPNSITYILTCINNLATSTALLSVRRRDTNKNVYFTSLSTTGKKELKFTADSEKFPNGWYVSILVTGRTSSTGSADISNLMLREASIADDAFEPYQTPTNERFKDYLPLSGGTLTRELTMSGSAVAMKGTNIDLAGDNPTSLTWSNSELRFRDNNNKRAGFINIARGTDGSTRLDIDAQCRKSDNSGDYYNGITIIARRDGTKAYAVSDPASFRAAIGAGTSSFSGSYDDLTNKPNNSITLWEAAEDQAPAAARIPNPNCARYIITVLLGNSSATTFDVDADYIGKTWLDANCGLSTSVDGDNLNFMLAIAPGTFDTIKIVKIVGIPK